MRIGQVTDSGGTRLAVLDGARTLVLARPHDGIASALDLLTSVGFGTIDPEDWQRSALAAGALADAGRDARPTMPMTPAEVWGAGVTYRRSADFREEGSGIYDRVYVDPRPELFFKATASRCVGPGEPIGRRRDSAFTATEPELAVVTDPLGSILGYTLANDVSAWDIERENPLYLPQSKVYRACFAFGPVIVTRDEIADPQALELRCRVTRGGREVFSGAASTSQMKRSIHELIQWLLRSNEVPPGTVLSTGTGIIQPMEVGLEEGDLVTIECAEIGVLTNPVALV
ncbi:MAG TPA: fumarylacetoacetate hydrolase family protein [Vicinamibacteria bacterium]|nr:fumarylacetoacetate hydrolase family protein [Vicinamibacteria bacterium]